MKDKNIKYIAVTNCSANKYQTPHVVKSHVVLDEEFEEKIKRLMDSEYYLTELEYS
jgi:hypothetical protein